VTAGLFTDGFRVELDRGFVKVNDNFETSVPGVYAIGDVIGGAMLAHAAAAEGDSAVNHMTGKVGGKDFRAVPSCVYSSPEIASVGLSEEEAKFQGHDVKTAKYLMSQNGKSLIEREERGFIKLVFDGSTQKILGGTLMCGRASDLIAPVALALANGLTVSAFKKTILPHPTFSEGLTESVKHAFFEF
jgi:dihydrolipoamide dehydrogenase